VHRTVQDAAKRKFNVVVSGLPEGEGAGCNNDNNDDNNNDNNEDCEAFLGFCEENLMVKPVFAHKGCIRLGKRIDERPRRLLVHLMSEESTSSLLIASKNLQRNEVTKNFYINPELSPAEAQLAISKASMSALGHRCCDSAGFHTDACTQN